MFRFLTALPVLAGLLLAPGAKAQDVGPSEPAYVNVTVPALAQVRFDDHLTKQTGEVRKFVTPPLPLSTKTYTYTLKATVAGMDGKDVTVEDKVQVSPGQTTTVDLTNAIKAAGGQVSDGRAQQGRGPSLVRDDSFGLWYYAYPENNTSSGSNAFSGSNTYSRGYDYPRYYDSAYRPAVGEHYVQGYYRSDGTYVRGHYQTNPDDSFWNNWSSKGNVNPHTGKVGTKRPGDR